MPESAHLRSLRPTPAEFPACPENLVQREKCELWAYSKPIPSPLTQRSSPLGPFRSPSHKGSVHLLHKQVELDAAPIRPESMRWGKDPFVAILHKPLEKCCVPFLWSRAQRAWKSKWQRGHNSHLMTLAYKSPLLGCSIKFSLFCSIRYKGNFTFTFHFHALEKEMAAHSSVLAWRIPGMGEPGGLLSMGSHRVGHDWSDLAAAPAAGTKVVITPWNS